MVLETCTAQDPGVFPTFSPSGHNPCECLPCTQPQKGSLPLWKTAPCGSPCLQASSPDLPSQSPGVRGPKLTAAAQPLPRMLSLLLASARSTMAVLGAPAWGPSSGSFPLAFLRRDFRSSLLSLSLSRLGVIPVPDPLGHVVSGAPCTGPRFGTGECHAALHAGPRDLGALGGEGGDPRGAARGVGSESSLPTTSCVTLGRRHGPSEPRRPA